MNEPNRITRARRTWAELNDTSPECLLAISEVTDWKKDQRIAALEAELVAETNHSGELDDTCVRLEEHVKVLEAEQVAVEMSIINSCPHFNPDGPGSCANRLTAAVEYLRHDRDEWKAIAERLDAKVIHEQMDHNKTVDRLIEANRMLKQAGLPLPEGCS